MDRRHAIDFLRELADDLERDMETYQYKGIDPATATDEEIEWLKQMGRTGVLREIEAHRARQAQGGDHVGDDADDASGGDGTPTGDGAKAVEDMTADELRAELKNAELPTSGAKPELVARVREHREAAA